MVTRLRALSAGLSGVLWLLALLALLFYLYVYASYSFALLAFPFDYDQGEGYDVYSGVLLSQGRWIYNDNNVYPFYSSNYPPLFSMLVSLMVHIVGANLFAGRLISVVASLLLGLLVYAIVQRGTRSRWIGIIAAAAFFSSTYVYHVGPLARVNMAMSLFALMGVYCMGRLGWRWLALGVFFLLAALYTKQTAADAIAAALIFLLVRAWRRAIAVGVILAALSGSISYLLDRISDGQFYLNVILANLNPYTVQQMEGYFRNFFEVHAVLLGLALTGLLLAAWRRSLSVYHVYLLTSLAFATAVGKWGAGESYFLNAVVATCVVAGLALGQLREISPFWLRPVLPLLILAQMPLFWHGPFDGGGLGLEDRGIQSNTLGRPPTSLDAANGWQIMTYVARSKGDLLLEESAFALVDHRAIVGNASQLLNLSQMGRWDDRGLVRELDQRRFGLVLLKAQFYPDAVMDAINRNYATDAMLEMAGSPFRLMSPLPDDTPLPEGDGTIGQASVSADEQIEPTGSPVIHETGSPETPKGVSPLHLTTAATATALPTEAVPVPTWTPTPTGTPTPRPKPGLAPAATATSTPTVAPAISAGDEDAHVEEELPNEEQSPDPPPAPEVEPEPFRRGPG